MNTRMKIEAAPLLAAAVAAGITVRGFTGLTRTRGSGTWIEAKSITRNGHEVTRLYVGIDVSGRCFVDWGTASAADQRAFFDVALRDDGELRFTVHEEAPAPDEPAWH